VRTVTVIDTLRPVIGLKYAGKLVHISDSSDVSQTAAGHANPAAQWSLFGNALMEEDASYHKPLTLLLASGSFLVACAMIATIVMRRESKSPVMSGEETPLNSDEQRRLSV